MNNDWYSYLVPTLFVGTSVFLNDVFGSGYLIDSPFLYIDIGTQMLSYTFSKLIIEYSFDKIFPAGFFENGFNLVAQPLVHGTISGLIGEFSIHKPSIRTIKYIAGSGGKLPAETHMGFFDGFKSGIGYNIIGTYLSMPIIA
jgi:hypothetical protein